MNFWRRKNRKPLREQEDAWAELNHYTVLDIQRRMALQVKGQYEWNEWLKRFPVWLRSYIRKGVFNPEPELYLGMYDLRRMLGDFPMPDGTYSDAYVGMNQMELIKRKFILRQLQDIFKKMKAKAIARDYEINKRYRRWTEEDEMLLLEEKQSLVPILKQLQALTKEFDLPE